MTTASMQARLAFLAAIVESSEDAIIGMDLDGVITSWNAAARHMYGYTAEEAVGQPCSLIVPSERLGELANMVACLRRCTRLEHFETVRVRKDGRRLDVSVSVSPIREANGRVIGAASIARDITDRKRVEEARAQLGRVQAARIEAEASARRFRLLSEASSALEEMLEPEAALAGIVRLVVPALADWCVVDTIDDNGQTRRVGSAHADVLTPELLRELEGRNRRGHAHVRGVARVLDTDTVGPGSPQLEHLHAMGLRSLMIVPMRAHGQTLGALTFAMGESDRTYGVADLAFAEDLARRCALALENARLYRESQQAVAARDEFLAATSHELRTPLGHVKGFVSTLRRTDIVFDEATRADFLAEVEREADRLAELIADLLDWSRVASSGATADRRVVASLADLVAGGLDRVRGTLNERHVCVDVPHDLPLVWVDASQVERVVANLVDNAVKYSPPQSTVRVLGHGDDDAVALRVEDEGLGVPPQHLARIFEPFFRETGGGWPTKPGTGLGLAVCRSIVQAHGGHIRAENRPQGGAAFTVTLPASRDT